MDGIAPAPTYDGCGEAYSCILQQVCGATMMQAYNELNNSLP